jgi:signal transduction histidine kinase
VHTAEIEARQRLELDLHDGAQERLVLAALTLRRAAGHASGTAAERLVAEALDQLQDGLAALRDLGRRIHPYALSRYGLATALEGLAVRAGVPVELRVTRERLQPALEAAIYSTVAEALANVAQHAQATRATVAVWRAGDAVLAEVVDDGLGGAVAADRSGLRRLADAAETLSGRLELDSPPGAGTRLRAAFPAKVVESPERSRPAPSTHCLHAAVDLVARGSS